MAITVLTRHPRQVLGDRRQATFEIQFTTAGNGNFDTGLSRVEWADIQAINDTTATNADIEVSLFRNNTTTTDNGTTGGSIHITGADVKSDTVDGIYQVRAVGW